MSIDTLNGVLGQPAHFAGDYLFRNATLPNNTTIHSGEHILNNTLGKLQLIGMINKNLSLTGSNAFTIGQVQAFVGQFFVIFLSLGVPRMLAL